MKPKVRDHYHSHRLSFWLHLISKLHKPGEEDIYLRHHLLYDHENPQSYDGIVRQIAFKFLEPLPTAPTLSKLNFNFKGNKTKSSLNYSKLLTKPDRNKTLSTFPLSTPLSVSTEQTILSSINSNINNNNNKTTATAIVMNENSYTTALTVTIVIGCSLLFLNILIFVGIYYQLNSSKQKRKKRIKSFDVSFDYLF